MIDNIKNIVFQGAKAKNLELSDKVLDRLNYELSIFETKGFIDYFILYSRIVEVCNNLKLIRSYGRGSAPNSLVNYCLDITNINPLDHNFRFERFIQPNQKNLPDIDIDIPTGTKDKIVKELTKRYSEYKAFPIAYLSNNMNFQSEEIIIENKSYRRHESGVLITKDIGQIKTTRGGSEDYYVCEDYKNDPLMQLKFDFVEQGCLLHYQFILDAIESKYEPRNIPLNNEKVLEVFRQGKTVDVYGFSDLETQEILRIFLPNSINDLALIFAMNRPPLNKWIPDVIKNKLEYKLQKSQSLDKVSLILAETYGIVVYQETFLDILIDVAGMAYTEAYYWLKKLERENTKGNQTLFIIEFSNKCLENNDLNKPEIAFLAILLLDTCQWTFQKTHALSHTLLAYWGVYYKVKFPKEFNQTINKIK